MKIKDYLPYFEPFLLYFVFFFPAVFASNAAFTSFFASDVLMINYIILSIPQILIFLYLFYRKKWDFKDIFCSGRIFKIIFFAIACTFLLLIISNSIVFLLKLTGVIQEVQKIETIKKFIPLYLLVSFITGYREELFFRAYLINFFEKTAEKRGCSTNTATRQSQDFACAAYNTAAPVISAKTVRQNRAVIAISTSALFAICHISQGAPGVIVSFINGVLLCFIFFRFRSIHINAISHALYNFFILLYSVFSIQNVLYYH
ncbi:MAG: CPBP family intramembrane metalloprotease [Spirochaetes bacterium]|nr:CPBP family intramembrane metalloprotease [Spirochaetota bacterium]